MKEGYPVCLARAFPKKGEKKELFMEHLADIEAFGDAIRLRSFLEGHAEIAAVIRKVDFENGMVFWEAAAEKRQDRPVNG